MLDNYPEYLIDQVKSIGRWLENNADKIVAKIKLTSDFNIKISFDQSMSSLSEIVVEQKFIDCNSIDILNAHEVKRRDPE